MGKKGKDEEPEVVVDPMPENAERATFMVELKSFTLPPDEEEAAPAAEAAPAEGEAAEGADAVEGGELEERIVPKRQFWSRIEISIDGTNPYESWWAGESEERKTQTDITTAAAEALSTGEATKFGYKRHSKGVPLTDKYIGKLSKATATITLFEGSHYKEDAEVPPVKIGSTTVDLESLVVDTSLSGVFELKSDFEIAAEAVKAEALANGGDAGEGGAMDGEQEVVVIRPTIEVDFSLDDKFSEAVLGGKLLKLKEFKIDGLPETWKVPAEEGVASADLAADPTKNVYTASFTLPIPSIDPDTKELQLGGNDVTMEGGALVWEPLPVEETVEGEEVVDEEAAEGTEAAAAPPAEEEEKEPEGEWRIKWDSEVKFFMTKYTILKWFGALDSDTPSLLATVKREISEGDDAKKGKGGKGAPPAEATDCVVTTVCDFGPLLEPGEDRITISGAAFTQPEPKEGETQTVDDAQKNTDQALALQDSESAFSFLTVLSSPMIVKPPGPPQPSVAPAELIPTRPPPAKPERDASQELQDEVQYLVSVLATEMNDLFINNGSGDAGRPLSLEERRRKLLYHLNTGGQYHTFKEKLKRHIVRVVREHFPQAPSNAANADAPPGTPSPADAFYSELYVYLMEQVNASLNDSFKAAAEDAEKSIAITGELELDESAEHAASLARLLLLAEEAEASMEWEHAAQRYRDRVTLAEKTSSPARSDIWFDYGVYCMRRGEHERAEECLRSCIAIDPVHVPALQAYGALLVERKSFEDAEVYLKGAIKAETDDSGSALASTRSHALLALYFDGEGHDMTGKLRKSELKAASRAGGDISTSAVLQAVCEYLLDCNLPLVAKRALVIMEHTVKQGVEKSIFRLSMRLLAGRQAMLLGPTSWEAAEVALATATEIDPSSADAWTHFAAVQYEKGSHAEARNSYSIALELLEKQGQPAPLQLYLRLGLLFLDEGEAGGAKAVYLKGCRAAVAADGAVASLWLGVGTACLRLEEWEAAEQCLAEANILNNQNEKVWGYLALLCMTVVPSRPSEADQALEQALRHGLSLPGLLRELASAYMAADKLDVAEKVFRRSLAAADSIETRSLLADVLVAQNSLEAALVQYEMIAEALPEEPEEQKSAALQQCNDLRKQLGRPEVFPEKATPGDEEEPEEEAEMEEGAF